MDHVTPRQACLHHLPQSDNRGASIWQGAHPCECGLVDCSCNLIPEEVEIGLLLGLKAAGAERLVRHHPREASILPGRIRVHAGLERHQPTNA